MKLTLTPIEKLMYILFYVVQYHHICTDCKYCDNTIDKCKRVVPIGTYWCELLPVLVNKHVRKIKIRYSLIDQIHTEFIY